jgi:hypothetical protein
VFGELVGQRLGVDLGRFEVGDLDPVTLVVAWLSLARAGDP